MMGFNIVSKRLTATETYGRIVKKINSFSWDRCIIRIMKARKMRWARLVARMGRRGTRIGCWWESQREGGH
jgi:hypothetical protein